ncbi:unnamed protein product [Gordionus sp. m RMFG-2023]
MKCFDIRTNEAIHTFFSNSESVRDVNFNPFDNFIFVAGQENGTIQLWDLRNTNISLREFSAHNGPAFSCEWHPQEKNILASAGRDKFIKVWDLNYLPKLKNSIQTFASVARVKWRPHNKYQIASIALVFDFNINIWDIRKPYISQFIFNEHKDVVTGIQWRGIEYSQQSIVSCGKDALLFDHKFYNYSYIYDHLPTSSPLNSYSFSPPASEKVLKNKSFNLILTNKIFTRRKSADTNIQAKLSPFMINSANILTNKLLSTQPIKEDNYGLYASHPRAGIQPSIKATPIALSFDTTGKLISTYRSSKSSNQHINLAHPEDDLKIELIRYIIQPAFKYYEEWLVKVHPIDGFHLENKDNPLKILDDYNQRMPQILQNLIKIKNINSNEKYYRISDISQQTSPKICALDSIGDIIVNNDNKTIIQRPKTLSLGSISKFDRDKKSKIYVNSAANQFLSTIPSNYSMHSFSSIDEFHIGDQQNIQQCSESSDFKVVNDHSLMRIYQNYDKDSSLDWMLTCAKEYDLIRFRDDSDVLTKIEINSGVYNPSDNKCVFYQVCEHNADIAMSIKRISVAKLWRMLPLLYCDIDDYISYIKLTKTKICFPFLAQNASINKENNDSILFNHSPSQTVANDDNDTKNHHNLEINNVENDTMVEVAKNFTRKRYCKGYDVNFFHHVESTSLTEKKQKEYSINSMAHIFDNNETILPREGFDFIEERWWEDSDISDNHNDAEDNIDKSDPEFPHNQAHIKNASLTSSSQKNICYSSPTINLKEIDEIENSFELKAYYLKASAILNDFRNKSNTITNKILINNKAQNYDTKVDRNNYSEGHNDLITNGIRNNGKIKKSSYTLVNSKKFHDSFIGNYICYCLHSLVEKEHDIQTSIYIIIVLGQKILPYISRLTICHWFSIYIDFLRKRQMYVFANKIIKWCPLDEINAINRTSTYYGNGPCPYCGKRPNYAVYSNTSQQNKSIFVCQKCRKHVNTCSICHLPVKGLYLSCIGCLHGGHLEHLSNWFHNHNFCPTGCGHMCEFN